MLRHDHVLVQQQENNGNCLSFAFRGMRWSVYSSLIAIVLFIGTIMIKGMDNNDIHYKEFLVPGGYLFSGLFIWSSIYSYFTKILLGIDGDRKIVKYRKSNFFGTKEWTKEFDSFTEVRLWLPGKTSFWKVLLRTKDDQEIPLGTSEVGVMGIDRARKMAESIAAIMNVRIIEEKVFWKR